MPRRTELPSLAHVGWLADAGLQHVISALSLGGGTVRVAGGALRNTLLGEPVADIDLATDISPDDIINRATKAGFSVHPTGIDHGTVTVVNRGKAFEITTLRRDLETDGRRAVVAFTGDWMEDAKRRDFTMNALYCDASGKIHDPVGGYPDILSRKVRFVGVPSQRIREDYLRILRFFRFHARFGKASPDAAGLQACARLKSGLKNLSAERVRQELLKLLEAPRAVATLKVMAKAGILELILPHTEDWRTLQRLPADGVLRLFVLAKHPDQLKEPLRLSNAQSSRIDALIHAPALSIRLSESERRRMLYQLGAQTWTDAARLGWARSRAKTTDADWKGLLDLPMTWNVPVFPVNGADLLARGHSPGPQLGQALHMLEDWWLACDFKPGKDELLAHVLPLGEKR